MYWYIVGCACVVISLSDYFSRRHKMNNSIEVDADVLRVEEEYMGFGEGDEYHVVLRYAVGGRQYEKRVFLGGSMTANMRKTYEPGSVCRIYCYIKNPRKIVLPDSVKAFFLIDILFMAAGIFAVCRQAFS
ncbi:MAG: hypothetical protein LBI44_08615 [Oscillospiraceae bacterium]|jgi:hypothetical protein|nr:hypothetical protein [Oscillospiraceae bacterium]